MWASRPRSPTSGCSSAADEPQNWLTYSRRLLQPALQRAPPDHPTTRGISSRSGCTRRPSSGDWQSTPLVVDGIMYITQRPNDVVALDAKTGRVFWIYRHNTVAGPEGLLRLEQSRRRDSRRHAVHGHARCAARRDTRRPAAPCGTSQVAELKAGLFADPRAAGGQGQGDRRRRRRRLGIRGFIAAYDAQHRQRSVALLHDSRARRAGPRNLGGMPAKPGDVLRSGSVEARRRIDLADRFVRPDAEPDLLGRRQRRSRLESGPAPGRQPLHRLGRRARCRHGTAPLALPVHAERRLRLRRGADPGAGRHARGTARASRRCSGPTATATSTCWIATTGKFLLGQAVREGELGERARRTRPADPDAAAAGQPT